jgi:hypothetical protein
MGLLLPKIILDIKVLPGNSPQQDACSINQYEASLKATKCTCHKLKFICEIILSISLLESPGKFNERLSCLSQSPTLIYQSRSVHRNS